MRGIRATPAFRAPASGCGRGFSLVELLVVVAIIAIIAAIALPSLLGSKISANEKAAVATLRLIGQAQVQFAAAGVADGNGNGNGEYGTLAELAGRVPVRAANGGVAFLTPTVVSPGLGSITAAGELVRGGYHYRLYLPDAAGEGLAELAGGGADGAVNAERAESIWCVYAWPARVGSTGRRTFFTNQTGEFYFADDTGYSGAAAAVPAGAALAAGPAATSMVGQPAQNAVGRDGNTWRTYGE